MAIKQTQRMTEDRGRDQLPQCSEMIQIFIDAGVEMEHDLEVLLGRRADQQVKPIR
jgi:hypothetical protein